MNYSLAKKTNIAVTGSIACGKSLIKKIFDDIGIPTIDADDVVHSLLNDNSTIIEKITTIFGKEILNPSHSVNRKKLGAIVFNDMEKKAILESIIHPEVYKQILDFIDTHKQNITVSIIPLLIETNKEKLFDSVWVVTANEKQQIERLKNRDGLTKDEALKRINSQMPQSEKIRKANIIIDNSGSIDNTKNQVLEAIKNI